MDAEPTPAALWRTVMLGVGFAASFCVYYLNYTAVVEEGALEASSPWALPLRIASVLLIFVSLLPLRRPVGPGMLITGLYLVAGCQILFWAGLQGEFNDRLYFNTLLQLPLLLAISASAWEIRQEALWPLLCFVLFCQVIGDAIVWYFNGSLWLSGAFVGGVGNPSSFGLLCTLGVAFCLFHPAPGRWRLGGAFVLGLAAFMTKSLFAVIAVAAMLSWWTFGAWRRAAAVVLCLALGVIAAAHYSSDLTKEIGADFVEHKLRALGALIGLGQYDIASAGSVSMRLEMYNRTMEALDQSPRALLWGGLGGQAYWPIDSQILTYLGSFGAVVLALFLSFHLYWMLLAWRTRSEDRGFALTAFAIFGLMFVTNRILDYFPLATVYFLLIAAVYRRSRTNTQNVAPSALSSGCTAPG